MQLPLYIPMSKFVCTHACHVKGFACSNYKVKGNVNINSKDFIHFAKYKTKAEKKFMHFN